MDTWRTFIIFFALIMGSEGRRMVSGRASSARISSRVSSRTSSRSSSGSSRSSSGSSRSSSSSSRSSSYRNTGSSYSNSQSGSHAASSFASRSQNDGYRSQNYESNSYSGYPQQQWSHEGIPFEAIKHNPGWSPQYYNHQFSGHRTQSLPKTSSVKMLGLGAGAGLLGGAASGIAGYHVLEKYQQYNLIRNGQAMNQSDQTCQGNCPAGSECVFGICDCVSGFVKNRGLCVRPGLNTVSVSDPPSNCSEHDDCQEVDINLLCTNSTEDKSNTYSGDGCTCRDNMEWSNQDKECQLMIDVDCEAFTENIAPSPAILEALNKMLAKNDVEIENNRTEAETKNKKDPTSLMSLIDPALLSEDDLEEAFCRDIDPDGFNLDKLRFDGNNENVDNEKPKKRITVSVALIITSVVILHIILILCIVLGIKKVCYCCRKSKKIFKKIMIKNSKLNTPAIQFSTVLQTEVEEDARAERVQTGVAESTGKTENIVIYETKQPNTLLTQ